MNKYKIVLVDSVSSAEDEFLIESNELLYSIRKYFIFDTGTFNNSLILFEKNEVFLNSAYDFFQKFFSEYYIKNLNNIKIKFYFYNSQAEDYTLVCESSTLTDLSITGGTPSLNGPAFQTDQFFEGNEEYEIKHDSKTVVISWQA